MEQKGFTIWSEKINDKGEDAYPTFLYSENYDRIVLAVYDGMGGAGSTMYSYLEKSYSGAYIAANEVKRILEREYEGFIHSVNTHLVSIDSLEENIFSHLKVLADDIDKNPSRLKSGLIKRLPTTISAIICESDSLINQNRKLTCFWAGDSRCYILSPEDGLVQLSIDDLKGGGDALQNIKSDAPLSNYCNADFQFILNKKVTNLQEPFIVFTATDGCFGYLPTPFHFEYLFLSSLFDHSTDSFDRWSNKITEEINKVTGDDFSMSLMSIGFNSFEEVQTRFESRFALVENSYVKVYQQFVNAITPLEIALENAKDEKDQMEIKLWENYKVNYHKVYG